MHTPDWNSVIDAITFVRWFGCAETSAHASAAFWNRSVDSSDDRRTRQTIVVHGHDFLVANPDDRGLFFHHRRLHAFTEPGRRQRNGASFSRRSAS